MDRRSLYRLEYIGEYVFGRHTSVSQYIAMRPIFGITVAEERRMGSPASMCWW